MSDIGEYKFKSPIHKHVHGFTWSWFIMPMGTLGLSLVLYELPYRFHGLTTIGIIIYLLGVTQFFALVFIISLRFALHRGSFIKSIAKESEVFFLATVLLAFVSILQGAHNYGHPAEGSNLASAIRVIFWIYASVAFCFSLYTHFILFEYGHLMVSDMTPAWILPSFPSILVGPTAGTITTNLTPEHRFPILICGLTFQGFSTLLAIFVYAIFFYRLFENHFPGPDTRPGLFLAVGPFSFAALGLTKMAASIPPDYSYFARHPASVEILQTVALFTSIFFWTLAFWFVSMATIACLRTWRPMKFHLTWYSFVFPVAGMLEAMIEIGDLLEAPAIGWLGVAGAIILTVVWIFVTLSHIYAVWKGRPLA